MNRIDQLILNRYPDQLDQIKNKIELLKLDYDEDQFNEEDILESILMELDII
jgi:DNA polymerase III delta subunit